MPTRSHLQGPLTALQVENEILRLLALLETRTEEIAFYATEAAQAEADHKRRWALHFTAASGTEKSKSASADLDSADEYMARKMTEAVYQAAKMSFESLCKQIDALRTLAANVRSQT